MKSITSALNMRVILDTLPLFTQHPFGEKICTIELEKNTKNFTNENQNKYLEGLVKKNNICSRKDWVNNGGRGIGLSRKRLSFKYHVNVAYQK